MNKNNIGDKYGTPWPLWTILNNKWHFKLDPCAWPTNRLGTPKFYAEEDDGLSQPWIGPTFCNPPYSDVSPWLEKAQLEARDHDVLSLFLLRRDASTSWWQEYIVGKTLVIDIPFRLKFINYETGKEVKDSYPFPSCLVLFHGLWV